MSSFSLLSNKQSTTSTLKELFHFLSDFKNFKDILPEDKVENFEYSTTQCSFNIRGITPMTIELIEKHACSYILFSSKGMAKFNFRLKVNFEGEESKPGICDINLSGDMNPFIFKMAEKPLQNLVNTMSTKLSQLSI